MTSVNTSCSVSSLALLIFKGLILSLYNMADLSWYQYFLFSAFMLFSLLVFSASSCLQLYLIIPDYFHLALLVPLWAPSSSFFLCQVVVLFSSILFLLALNLVVFFDPGPAPWTPYYLGSRTWSGQLGLTLDCRPRDLCPSWDFFCYHSSEFVLIPVITALCSFYFCLSSSFGQTDGSTQTEPLQLISV